MGSNPAGDANHRQNLDRVETRSRPGPAGCGRDRGAGGESEAAVQKDYARPPVSPDPLPPETRIPLAPGETGFAVIDLAALQAQLLPATQTDQAGGPAILRWWDSRARPGLPLADDPIFAPLRTLLAGFRSAGADVRLRLNQGSV